MLAFVLSSWPWSCRWRGRSCSAGSSTTPSTAPAPPPRHARGHVPRPHSGRRPAPVRSSPGCRSRWRGGRQHPAPRPLRAACDPRRLDWHEATTPRSAHRTDRRRHRRGHPVLLDRGAQPVRQRVPARWRPRDLGVHRMAGRDRDRPHRRGRRGHDDLLPPPPCRSGTTNGRSSPASTATSRNGSAASTTFGPTAPGRGPSIGSTSTPPAGGGRRAAPRSGATAP